MGSCVIGLQIGPVTLERASTIVHNLIPVHRALKSGLEIPAGIQNQLLLGYVAKEEEQTGLVKCCWNGLILPGTEQLP